MVAIGAFLVCLFLASYQVHAEENEVPNVEPEELDMLLETGQYEEFARLMKIDDVSLVIPKEGARSEHPMFHEGLEFGDILMSEEQARQGMRFDKYPRRKWPNKRVPYAISTRFNDNQRKTIEDGIKRWNAQDTCVKLVPRNGDNDYVDVFPGDGCYARLGRSGGQQPLSLGNGCVYQGTIIHEFEHAIGFAHEHNRNDRDNSVEVLWNNIPERWKEQYKKTNPDHYGLQQNYDYYSIMHYPTNAPGTRDPAFRYLRSGVDSRRVGNGDDFTSIDLAKVRQQYC